MADDDDELGPLKTGLSDLLESGLFSDLKICCRDGAVYNVHKNILCAQSSFFKNALNPSSNFLEARSNMVKLENDDPAAVKALVEYFYRFKYTNLEVNEDQLLIFHALVYAVGETYRVQGLKALAKVRFKNTLMDAKRLKDLDFPNAVKTVYSTTVESDRGLRQVVVSFAHWHLDTFKKMKNFLEMMDDYGPFGKDLSLAGLDLGPPSTNWWCNHCGNEVLIVLLVGSRHIYCPSCGKKSKHSTWICRTEENQEVLGDYDCPNCRTIVSMELSNSRTTSKTFAPCCGVPQLNDDWEKAATGSYDDDPSNEESPSGSGDG